MPVTYSEVDTYKENIYRNLRDYYDSGKTIDFQFPRFEYIDDIVNAIDDLDFVTIFNEFAPYALTEKDYFKTSIEGTYRDIYEFNWNLNFIDNFDLFYHVLLYLEIKIYNDIKLAVKNLKTSNIYEVINYIIKDLIYDDIVYTFIKFQDSDEIIKVFDKKMQLINNEIKLILKGAE